MNDRDEKSPIRIPETGTAKPMPRALARAKPSTPARTGRGGIRKKPGRRINNH
jgi:hypothetical protein